MPDIDTLIRQDNIAEILEDEELQDIGSTVSSGVQKDEESRADWLEQIEYWLKLATQVKEQKNTPWPNAANVKYPLLTTSSIQFHARSYPNLVTNNPVHIDVLGHDPDGSLKEAGQRVAKHLSYQVRYKMEGWDEDMDRLCMILPVTGAVYKKTYYSPIKDRNVSELLLPDEFIINYYAKSLETASRKTHVMYLTPNEVKEHQRAGIYRDVDLPSPETGSKGSSETDTVQGKKPPSEDEDAPYKIYEVHTFLDLDEDDYKEPYIVTVESGSGEVLRIVARYDINDVEKNVDTGEIRRILPREYFTDYIFIPDPTSSVHGLAFGHLLGPTNEAANTLINQLVDAGTLSNMQSGFLAKGVRIKGGSLRFKPGEWKYVQTAAEDLQKGVYPLPVREPSQTLFALLGTLLESGDRLGSITDIMVGQNPGQNQPATTTMAVLEQGTKVFSGIFKRIYRSLTKEYYKIYRLNYERIDELRNEYRIINGPDVNVMEDYDLVNIEIRPNADPDVISDAQKLMKAEALWPLVQMGTVNPQVATRKMLEAQGQEDIEELMQVPEPQPEFETQLEMQKQEHEQQLDWANLQLESLKAQAEYVKNETAALYNLAKASSEDDKIELERYKAVIEGLRNQEEVVAKKIENLESFIQKAQAVEEQEPRERGMEREGMPERAAAERAARDVDPFL